MTFNILMKPDMPNSVKPGVLVWIPEADADSSMDLTLDDSDSFTYSAIQHFSVGSPTTQTPNWSLACLPDAVQYLQTTKDHVEGKIK